MRYLKYFESRESIDSICKKYGIKNYTINSDGTVDVNGNVNLSNCRLQEIPLKFGYVSGNFYCGTNKLTTLKGAPREVGGSFGCGTNELTSLEGAPIRVDGYFDCCDNKIVSLQGGPKEVGGDFDCDFNELTTLIGAPEDVGGDFYCVENPALPQEIWDNRDYINKIVKYQYDYNIWRRDGSLDKYRFSDMMKEILEEQR
jgi:hypothetical protein